MILDDGERRLFDEELQAMPTDEREDVMEFTNSWIEEGRQQGRAEALAEAHEEARAQTAAMVLGLLRRRLGTVSGGLSSRVEALSRDRLAQLADDLFNLGAPTDLERWLEEH